MITRTAAWLIGMFKIVIEGINMKIYSEAMETIKAKWKSLIFPILEGIRPLYLKKMFRKHGKSIKI